MTIRAERSLTSAERARYAPFFDAALLDGVRIIEPAPFWLRRDMIGVTLGRRIYFRPGAYDPTSHAGITLLAHELVHVRQYAQGMTLLKYLWASRRGYWRNPYEVQARDEAGAMVAQPMPMPMPIPSIDRATDSATSIPSTPADMMPPA